MRTFLLLLLVPSFALAEEIFVDSMSMTTNWVLTGQRVCYVLGKSKMEAVKEPVRAGTEGSLKLTYDLDRRYWVGIQWRGEPLLGRVEALSLWVYGDAAKHQLVARFEDANARNFEVRLGPIDWKEWRKVAVPMDEAKWTPILRHAEERLPVRWPVTLREIRINKANAQALLGSIAFSELRAICRVQPVDRVGISVTTDAPANVFYPPEPVKLRAAFANPAKTSLEGRIETVVCDWLGREQHFEGDALSLPPEGKTLRELSLPLTALGAYQAWVRFIVGDSYREASKQFAISRKTSEPAKLDLNSPFGMGLYLPRFQKDTELLLAIKLAREAGVKWTRDGLSVRLSPEPGRWAWEGPQWVMGHEGGAVEFFGGRNFIVQSSASLNRPCATGELTLAFWIKFLKFDYSDRWRTLLGKGEGAQRQFLLFLTVPTRQIAVSFGDGANSWTDIPCSKSDCRVGQWYHVVMVHRRADKSVRWWVDGAPAGAAQTRFANTLIANELPFQIGRSLDFALDDFAIYDKALTPEQIGGAKPIAHWTFDEGQGLRAADASGNGNHAEMKPFRSDFIFEQAAAAGISSYAVLMGTPKWMASKPVEDMDRPWNVMPQLDKWSEALQTLATRYKERGIRVWEIWNEPNIEPFWSPKPDAAEYYKVLAASYAAIKKGDPQATVLGCSLAGPHGRNWAPPWEFTEAVLKLGGGKVMDAISIHPYRQPSSPEESDYIGDIKAISDLTAKYGRRLPIWITEVGWPNDTGGSSEVWATKMLPRAYLLALACGVKNIAWYDYHDDGQDPSYLEHNCGLLLYDLTPKPAYFAFRTMATELADMRFEKEIPAGDGATVLLFASKNKRTAVAWSHRKEVAMAFQVRDGKEVESVELMGNAERCPVRDGALLATLSEAPIFLRNVPAQVAAVRPITCEPPVLKLPREEAGEIRVTIQNPFQQPLVLTAPGRVIGLGSNVRMVTTFNVPYALAVTWKPPVWRSPDGQVELQTPARVVALAGQREPVFQRPEETKEPVTIPHTPVFNATDEVTVSCWLRSDGPSDTWQTLVGKYVSDIVRNYGLYLGREKGELCFSASFERGTFRHNDFNSGVSMFDGKTSASSVEPWRHIAATYSKHDAEVCFYVDGKSVKRQAFDGGDLKTNTAPITIANGFILTEGKAKKIRASVRDIRIWNRALTAQEIAHEKEQSQEPTR
jgi:hypothetical protein